MASGYLSFLLRVWRGNSDDSIWRASLEDPHTGERHAFATLEGLYMFLDDETRALTRHEGDVPVEDDVTVSDESELPQV